MKRYYCFSHVLAERLLVVVSGEDAANSDVEVLDVESTRLVCDKPVDIPIKVFNHVAATGEESRNSPVFLCACSFCSSG